MGDWTQVFCDSGDTCYLTDTEEEEEDDNINNIFKNNMFRCSSYRTYKTKSHMFNSNTVISPSKTNIKNTINNSKIHDYNLRSVFSHTPASKRNYSYEKTLKALDSLITQRPQKKTTHKQADNLEVMHWCIEKLKLDLSKLSIIHVAGTKGKGSTCAFCESILRSAGYKTGLFTSPHLVDVRERIRINGDLVDSNIFMEHFWENWDQLREDSSSPSMASYFRFLTLLAFKIFLAEQVDVAIIEVGIGGRLDATNVIPSPVVCGISSLALDHCNILGNTIEEIAFEKAGIIKKNRPIISVPQVPEAMKVIEEKAKKESANITLTPEFEEFETLQHSSRASVVDAPQHLRLGINGTHQKTNASLALSLARIWMDEHHTRNRHSSEQVPYFDPQEDNYRKFDVMKSPFKLPVFPPFRLPHSFVHGLACCHWPGRSQVMRVPGKNITFYLDGAHTVESIEFCRDWFLNATTEEHLENHTQDTSGNSSSGEDSSLSTHHSNPIETYESYNDDDDDDLPYRRQKKKNSHVHRRKRQRVLVFNITGERDSKQLLEPFAESRQQFDEVVLCPTDSVKESLTKKSSSTQTKRLDRMQEEWHDIMENKRDSVPASVVDSVDHLVERCMKTTKTKNISLDVLVTGSLYLVGDVLNKLSVDLLFENK